MCAWIHSDMKECWRWKPCSCNFCYRVVCVFCWIIQGHHYSTDRSLSGRITEVNLKELNDWYIWALNCRPETMSIYLSFRSCDGCRRLPEPKHHSFLFNHWTVSKCLFSMAACTPSIHVFLGRPLFLLSSGIHSIINFGSLSSCILLTCPYHRSLFLSIMSIMSGSSFRQKLLFLYFVYSIWVDTNLKLAFMWIFCITNIYGFWRLDISIFIKCKSICFHYSKQFILIGVQQAWNFVSSTTKPK